MATAPTANKKGAAMSAINSQTNGPDGVEDGRMNDSDGGTRVTEELIAHVLGRAHRERSAQRTS